MDDANPEPPPSPNGRKRKCDAAPPLPPPPPPPSPPKKQDGRKRKRDKREIVDSRKDRPYKSGGHSFSVRLPPTHDVVTISRLNRLTKQEQIVKNIKSCFQNKKFVGATPFMKSLLATALSNAAAFPLSQAAHTIPLVVAAFLEGHGILDKSDTELYSRSFPSDTWLRELLFDHGAQCTYDLGERLKGQKVFLACDKGSKKGVGHFVKVFSYWCEESMRVIKQVGDIDGSEGTTDECAKAIVATLMKFRVEELQGQTTDSGGGGVLDTLADALKLHNVCPLFGYLVGACTIHCFQLSLGNPITKCIGIGGLGQRNVMQLLHSVYYLQDCMDLETWTSLVQQATGFLNAHYYKKDSVPYEGESGVWVVKTQEYTKHPDEEFRESWEKIQTFRAFPVPTDEQLMKPTLKFQCPVLTRWETVGKGATILWENYPLIFVISQFTCNWKKTSNKYNTAASNLQSLLLEEDIFSDLALIYDYHKNYMEGHFDWLQQCTDMTQVPGFQTHNVLGRYYFMMEDLKRLKASIEIEASSDCDVLENFKDTLTLLKPASKELQVKKAKLFFVIGGDAITDHFDRWRGHLLPAAVVSEGPMAMAVACILKGRKELPTGVSNTCVSHVHRRVFKTT